MEPRPGAEITAVLFDLDGTLVDTAVKITEVLNRMRQARGRGAIAADPVRRSVSLGAEAMIRACLGEALIDLDADLAAFRAALGATASDPGDLYPGVPETLERLSAVRLGVVTNKPENLARKVLEDLGLSHRFGVVVGGDTVSRPKPSAAPMEFALRALGCGGDQALMVGDSDVDAEAARAAGCAFALFTGGYGPRTRPCEGAVVRFSSFAAFPLADLGLVDDAVGIAGGRP